MDEEFLRLKLQQRIASESFRQLHLETGGIDFCSNDYLGIVKNGFLHINEQAGRNSMDPRGHG